MFSKRHTQHSPSGTDAPSPASNPDRGLPGRDPGTKPNERGVALLLTLGVLSLLLILAMSFAFMSRTERMASGVNADMVKARLLGESCVERVTSAVDRTGDLDWDKNEDASTRTVYTTTAEESKSLFPLTSRFYRWNNKNGATDRWFPILASIAPSAAASTSPAQDIVKFRRYQIDKLGLEYTKSAVTWGYIKAAMPTTPVPEPQSYATDALYWTALSTFAEATRDDIQSPIGWIPITVEETDTLDLNDNGNRTDTVRRLAGRVAYIVIDQSGKIDPAWVVPTVTPRKGDVMQEIALTANEFGFTSDDFKNSITPQYRAFSWGHIFKALGLSASNADKGVAAIHPMSRTEAIAGRQMAHMYDLGYQFYFGGTPAFPNTIDTESAIPASKGTAKVAELVGADGIPWLTNWKDADKGTFADGAARAKQIAANIVDYFDDDDHNGGLVAPPGSGSFNGNDLDFIPTTDWNGTIPKKDYDPGTVGNYPTYAGIEHVPFMNDMRCKVQNTSVFSDPDGTADSGDENWSVNLSVEGRVELCYMFPVDSMGGVANPVTTYPERFGKDCQLDMAVRITYNTWNALTSAYDVSHTSVVALNWSSTNIPPNSLSLPLVPPPAGPAGGSRYLLTGTAAAMLPSAPDPTVTVPIPVGTLDPYPTGTVVVTQIEVLGAILRRKDESVPGDGKFWDAARAVWTPAAAATAPQLSPPGGPNARLAVWTAEVDDPRQNHNTADWLWTGTTPTTASGDLDAAAAKNSICSPNPGGDKDNEPLANFDAASFVPPTSAYMRNMYPPINRPDFGPPITAADLGIIHRGAKWETLNLCKFQPNAVPGAGGGAYQDGDRNILGQVWLRQYIANPGGALTLTGGFSPLEAPYLQGGRVNPNSPFGSASYPGLNNVGAALFKDIKPGDSTHPPCDPASGDLSAYTSDLLTAAYAAPLASGKPYYGPTDLLNRLGPAVSTIAAMDDRQKEAALLFTNDLMSPRWTHYTAIIVAQSIKDVPERIQDPANNVASYADDDGDEVGYGYYDSPEVTQYVKKHSPVVPGGLGEAPVDYTRPLTAGDRILAESKILVHFSRNAQDTGFVLNDAKNANNDKIQFTDGRHGMTFTFLGHYPNTGKNAAGTADIANGLPLLNAHRYYISEARVDTWERARRICEDLGGHLVTLESEKEWEAVRAFLHNGTAPHSPVDAGPADGRDFWIGLYRTGDMKHGAVLPKTRWSWVDASAIDLISSTPPPWWGTVPAWDTGEPEPDSSTGADKTGPASVSSVVMAASKGGDDWRWKDTSRDNGGTTLRFILECEPRIRVDGFEYIDE